MKAAAVLLGARDVWGKKEGERGGVCGTSLRRKQGPRDKQDKQGPSNKTLPA
jgi:hypothetical protein